MKVRTVLKGLEIYIESQKNELRKIPSSISSTFSLLIFGGIQLVCCTAYVLEDQNYLRLIVQQVDKRIPKQ